MSKEEFIINRIFKSYSNQLADYSEESKLLIKQDIREITRKTSLVTQSSETEFINGLYRKSISMDLSVFIKNVINELINMEKPYLQFLESYPPIQ